ncbi:Hypothetical protein P9211_13231 [Prochlorococcus marinus str. MIT 9211]|uniref:Uncharacterized protein n=2 Tax=Prochlorococcus marinus TaxID=1219 RepID=A9BBP2_PROM4|nr:Hypothetical protein P9211_13231 [Prochlorococcus marinus str. MIT 9211]
MHMNSRSIAWVNTPVIMEAMLRYQENRLPRPMKLWLEKLLDINTSQKTNLVTNIKHH